MAASLRGICEAAGCARAPCIRTSTGRTTSDRVDGAAYARRFASAAPADRGKRSFRRRRKVPPHIRAPRRTVADGRVVAARGRAAALRPARRKIRRAYGSATAACHANSPPRWTSWSSAIACGRRSPACRCERPVSTVVRQRRQERSAPPNGAARCCSPFSARHRRPNPLTNSGDRRGPSVPTSIPRKARSGWSAAESPRWPPPLS